MNLPRLPHLILIGLVFSVLVMPGYAEQREKKSLSANPTRYGGIYRVPLMGNPPILDPAYVQDEFSTAVVQQLFDGLVKFDPYLMVLPALAESWQVEEQG